MESATITDSKGRVLEVKRLSGAEKMRLFRGWGIATNSIMWANAAMTAAFVRTLDGVPVAFPDTVAKVESLVDKLGEEGTDAISEWFNGLAQDINEAAKAEAKN